MDQIHAIGQLPDTLEPDLPRHIVTYAGQLSDSVRHQSQFTPERVEDLNQQTIAGLQSEVDKIRLVVRIGPSLGLMGTLIPMGTGLAGLTQGNMAQLSSSLILAFTTTVVGLALGIGAHFFTVIRTRWMMTDLRLVNMITEAIARTPDSNIKEARAT
jgi:biopolymer transport protein ExbB/TolQ